MVITELFCIFKSDKQTVTKLTTMITKDKVTEIFCIIDEFDKNIELELQCCPKRFIGTMNMRLL